MVKFMQDEGLVRKWLDHLEENWLGVEDCYAVDDDVLNGLIGEEAP